MKKTYYFLKIFATAVIILFGSFLIISPEPCKTGAMSGLLLCGRIIIPSLFPFTMCVLYISKSGILEKLSFISPFTKVIFGLNFYEFSIMLMSMIGGYPLGAKIINDSVADKKISPELGKKMICFCVNAGPAFIISAVGNGILHSQKIGVILFTTHILSSIIICELSRFLKYESVCLTKFSKRIYSPADNFVLSAAEAASSVIKICSFVVLFSVIDRYIQLLQKFGAIFKALGLLLEVTTALTKTNNVYLVAFLLGFGGVCVWCQILAVANNIKLNLPLFLASRIVHGVLSAALVRIAVKLFKIEITVFSSQQGFKIDMLYSTPALTLSVIIMAIVFVISVSTKKISGKILEDIV